MCVFIFTCLYLFVKFAKWKKQSINKRKCRKVYKDIYNNFAVRGLLDLRFFHVLREKSDVYMHAHHIWLLSYLTLIMLV